ncbi:MAG TPA: DUF5343 domain-containing protein [Rhizomicrobium sp.]|nr:DUF5343 domain-containing protein [Rhizomicrobium sp.]
MAVRRKTEKKKAARIARDETTAEPKFPYCITPKSLRRFLEMVPQKPKPPKVTGATLKVWNLKNTNDQSILRVLKAVDLLGPTGDTTPTYAEFMTKDKGPAALGKKIQSVYSTLFENVPNPETASNSDLTNFFNIHSGGGERTIRYQIDTFKALAAYATFGKADPLSGKGVEDAAPAGGGGRASEPMIRVDLHIHLPENKSRADYDALLESIATHLYGLKK